MLSITFTNMLNYKTAAIVYSPKYSFYYMCVYVCLCLLGVCVCVCVCVCGGVGVLVCSDDSREKIRETQCGLDRIEF